MTLMENGRMDSTSEISPETDQFIIDLGSKVVKSCYNDSANSFEVDNNNSIPTKKPIIENNFANCNGNASPNRCELNGDDSSKKTNSSQCGVKNSVSSLESDLSTLSIKPEITCNQCSDFNIKSQSCDDDGKSTDSVEKADDSSSEITYISYESENQMPDIMKLIQKDLSEPYSIYTYRYFIHNWPHLCFLAVSKGRSVGAIVCKLDLHRKVIKRGYIAMLAVDECFRKQGIGSNLVLKAIRVMAAEGADEVVLETEITNQPALRLYENLGFVRDKRLFRYYLNGVDALRLKLWLR